MITDRQVSEMRAMRRRGASLATLARRFCTSVGYVSDICSGKARRATGRRPYGAPLSVATDCVISPGPLSTPCWLWRWRTSGSGYAYLSPETWPHRVLFERERGPIPPGLEPDHLCRRRACINPWHLELVAHTENVHRGLASRLDWPTVDKIRAARAGGATLRAITREFGIAMSSASTICAQKTWRGSVYCPSAKPSPAPRLPDHGLSEP